MGHSQPYNYKLYTTNDRIVKTLKHLNTQGTVYSFLNNVFYSLTYCPRFPLTSVASLSPLRGSVLSGACALHGATLSRLGSSALRSEHLRVKTQGLRCERVLSIQVFKHLVSYFIFNYPHNSIKYIVSSSIYCQPCIHYTCKGILQFK